MPELDEEELRNRTDDMVEIVSSEAYLRQLEKVHEAPDEQKMVAASRYLTPEALREAGIDLPGDARISSRYFEPGLEVDVGDAQEGENVINVLNERYPGLLDRLRRENPGLFKEITKDENGVFGRGSDIGPLALCYCYGGKDSGCHGFGL
jgi:hypothetical protein